MDAMRDFKRSLEAEVEPKLFAVTNRMGVLAAALGSVERGIVTGAAAVALLGGVALLCGTVYAPDIAATAASAFAAADAIVAVDPSPVAAAESFSRDVASLLY